MRRLLIYGMCLGVVSAGCSAEDEGIDPPPPTPEDSASPGSADTTTPGSSLIPDATATPRPDASPPATPDRTPTPDPNATPTSEPPIDDVCARSSLVHAASSEGPWYRTICASEHAVAQRTQLFPDTCTTDELSGGVPLPIVQVRQTAADYPSLYNVVTRNRDELFAFGGNVGQQGAFVAKLDADAFEERWRFTWTDHTPEGQWSYTGVVAVHGNGDVYAVAGNVIVRLDADTGQATTAPLPELPDQTGAGYNGLVILDGGEIALKKMERGPCDGDGGAGLECVVENNLPSTIVIVDPDSLEVIDQIDLPEAAIGRIMADRRDAIDYLYVPGVDYVHRYRYSGGVLEPDPDWGPLLYRTGEQQPATAVGIMGDFAILQTNFLASTQPLVVYAVDVRDSSRVFTLQPFDVAPSQDGEDVSWIAAKSSLDTENGRLYTHDFLVGELAAIRLDDKGLSVDWSRGQTSAGFSILTGPASDRELILPDFDEETAGEQLVWRDAASGAEEARSPVISGLPTFSITAPGFDGRFYYPSPNGRVVELTIRPK